LLSVCEGRPGIRDRGRPLPSSQPLVHSLCDHTTGHVWRMVKVENSMRRILRWTDMRHKPFRSDCHVELDCYSSNRKTTLPEVIENASVAIWKYLAHSTSR